MQYPDHHVFSRDDICDIEKTFSALHGRYKFIMTTEKDAVRIANNPYFPTELKQHIFYQPVNVEFIQSGKKTSTLSCAVLSLIKITRRSFINHIKPLWIC